MNSNFINKYSWKCLLGRQSKNIKEEDGLYFWEVGDKKHFCTDRVLKEEDLSKISGNFHYMTEDNVNFLKKHKKISKTKNISIQIDLTKLKYEGSENKNVRQSINRAKKNNFVVLDNYKDINDVKIMLDKWSNVLAEKYFRDFSGKNLYFYSNNYHKDCLNVFVYDDKELISFGTASREINGVSSYVIGKALCNKYAGLSEYTDYLLYNKCIENNTSIINLGQASKGLLFYKEKFSGSSRIVHFDGTIISV